MLILKLNAKDVIFNVDKEMIEKKDFCKYCPFHNKVELIHTKLNDETLNDYCPRCQELFGEKIWKIYSLDLERVLSNLNTI